MGRRAQCVTQVLRFYCKCGSYCTYVSSALKWVHGSDRCLGLSVFQQVCNKMSRWITHRKVCVRYVCLYGRLLGLCAWVSVPLSICGAANGPVKVRPQKPLSSVSAGIMSLTWLVGSSRCCWGWPGAAAHCLLWSAGQGQLFPSLRLSLPSLFFFLAFDSVSLSLSCHLLFLHSYSQCTSSVLSS